MNKALCSVAMATCMLMLHACASSNIYQVRGILAAPHLNGSVQVERLEGRLRLVTVMLKGTPELPPENMLVLWLGFEPGTPAQNMGALEYDKSGRHANLMVTVKRNPQRVLVTIEKTTSATAASARVLVNQPVQAP